MQTLLFIALLSAPANATPAASASNEADLRVLPMVVLRGAAAQRFSVVIDGRHRGVLNGEMALADLAEGEHTVELRTENNLVIWARGTLTLVAGDEIVLHVAEGRSVTIEGRPSAWKTATAGTSHPRKTARTEDG